MTTQHTPGPWAMYLNTMDDVVVWKMNEAGYKQCTIARGVNYKNARLIAAAPDLLAALQAFIDGGYDREIAITAIAKVTGE